MNNIFKLSLFLFGFGLLCGIAVAQEEEAWAKQGEPLETEIVGRDWAVRLRFETLVTDESEGLLQEDPAYRYVPSLIVASDARVITRNRVTVGAWFERWETDQDLESRRYGSLLSVPLGGSWSSRLRLVRWEQDTASDRDFAYLSASGFLTDRLFSTTEYQYMRSTGREDTHQIYEYLGLTVHPRLRLGVHGSIKYDSEKWDVWSAGGSAMLELVSDWTTTRTEFLAGGGDTISDYTEVRMTLYQRLSSYFTLRPDIRLYWDENDRESYAVGIKLLAYLTPALDVQLGYRYYTQNDGGDFNTVTVGLGLLF
jgi:hypothetical protein